MTKVVLSFEVNDNLEIEESSLYATANQINSVSQFSYE